MESYAPQNTLNNQQVTEFIHNFVHSFYELCIFSFIIPHYTQIAPEAPSKAAKSLPLPGNVRETPRLFFPVFITEMTFLGEKIFGKGVNRNKIYKEVDDLVSFLLTLANRKTGEYSTLEHGGEYSKFAIRIVGKQYKIEEEGKRIYVNNIRQITQPIETLYLIGNSYNQKFIDEVSSDLIEDDVWEIFHRVATNAKLRTSEGEEFEVNNYITTLRKKSVTIVTRR